jgi:ADP-ribosylglycohydrolase
MLGAIIGDLAGSTYEYQQFCQTRPVKNKKLLRKNSFYSDDTILTMAIADAILNGEDYGKKLREYVQKYISYKPNIKPYFERIFSPEFYAWSLTNTVGISAGNGAMMRISPVGFLFDNEEEVIKNARLACISSHNSEEAISNATIIARVIFLARKGLTKEEIKNKLGLKCQKPKLTQFNRTCSETIDVVLFSFFKGNSFEECIKLAISFGGDTDTNACIVGGMAEAMYGIDESLKEKALEYLPEEFKDILKKVYKKS